MNIPKRRLAAIMFTDIVGYSTLMGRDEDQAFEVLKKSRRIHQGLIEKYNGVLIKELGDGMLISFDLASDAVRCAMDLQKKCINENIPLKIGIHEGEMVFEGTDVLGDGVNISARIQDNAKKGSIYISGNVYDAVKNKSEIQTRLIGDKRFKNIKDPVRVFEVLLGNAGGADKEAQNKARRRHTHFIIIGILVIAVIALALWRILPYAMTSNIIEKEKSIAVMPFDNESSDPENEYFVNGMMEDIRNNLSRVRDLRVISKTSTEKYRNTRLSIPEIARELNVNFILEGTVSKVRNQVRIHAQLIDAGSDDHIWADTYDRDLSDVFKVQSEIAQIIARELYSSITPEEKEIIDNPLTTSITAYQLFNRARQFHEKYWMEGTSYLGIGVMSIQSQRTEDLDKAITLYRSAIEIDSTFAQAYSGLGIAMGGKYLSPSMQEKPINDSILFLANKALSFNPQLDEAYFLLAIYKRYAEGNFNEAIEHLKTVTKINPSYAAAYLEMGAIYIWEKHNYVEGLNALYKAYDLDKSYLFPVTLEVLASGYLYVGFFPEAEFYIEEAFKIKRDTLTFYNAMAFLEWCRGDIQSGIQIALGVLEKDSLNKQAITYLTLRYSYIGDMDNTNRYFKVFMDQTSQQEREARSITHRIAYILHEKGALNEAKKYFYREIELCENSIQARDLSATWGFTYYDLFAVYSFLQEYDKAFQYLELLSQEEFYPTWLMTYFKWDPLLVYVKEDQRYLDFKAEAEMKFKREHDRVQAWLDSERELNSSP